MHFVNKLFAGLLGVFTAIYLLNLVEPPYVIKSQLAAPNNKVEPPVSQDREKQLFAETFKATYEEKNPRNEMDDFVATNFNQELRKESSFYNKSFAQLIPKIKRDGCPLKEVKVPTRWVEGNYGKERTFIVFDIDNCKN